MDSASLSASDQQQLLWWEQRLHNNRTLLGNNTGTGNIIGGTGSVIPGHHHHHHHHHHPSTSNSDVMNQLCRVCGEPAAGFHFGAFTCEGCKSFFGRTYNNLSSISECKNGGQCVINKKNRTSCKACRLRKCLVVGMSKSGSRYGRRSNWFKIHCLLQEQSNNNNNNSIQSIQQSTGHHLDSKLISSKNSDNSSSSWHKKESSPTLINHHHHHNNQSGASRSSSVTAAASLLPDLRNISDLRTYTSSNENAASLAAAAAAFWASRGTTLLPHLPSSADLATSQVPLSPFLAAAAAASSSPFSNRSFLFPYLSPPVPPKPNTPVSTTNSNSPPPSSNTSSCCSSPNEKIPRIFEKEKDTSLSGLALLRTLGPVQEQPMDLSVKSDVPIVKREQSDNECSDVEDEEEERDESIVRSNKRHHSRSTSPKASGSKVIEGISECNKLDHPAKPTTPLDLTTKI